MRKFRLLGALAVSAIGLIYAGPAWAGTGVSGTPTVKPHPITASGFDPKSVTIGGARRVADDPHDPSLVGARPI